jgi:eukaryotic-like serine/threonine-protein kinase
MGTVYRGWDHGQGVPVAIKLLHAIETADRFEREARVLSQIDHPNIVRYVAHGMTPTGEAWLAMEWLDGVDLSAHLKAHAMTTNQTQKLGRAVAAGLSWAHERGFVHRDMKPSNVLITHGEFALAKVVDFGLARDVAHDEVLTKTGALIGTLDYMPPEQLTDAKRVDARADVFSLGAVMFRCLTGRAPVTGKSLPELVMNIVRQPVPPISQFRSDVPLPLMNLIMWMLQKDPDLRPPDATTVLHAFDAIERDEMSLNDFEGVTELTERPDFIEEREPASWRSLEGTGTVRMDRNVPSSPVSSPASARVPPAPSREVTSAATSQGPLPERRSAFRDWWAVTLLALVTLGLVVAALYR